MTILFGLITAFLVEAIKKIKARFGNEFGTKIIYGIVFLIAVVWTIITSTNIISPETINKIITIVATAVATYEIFIKRLSAILPSVGAGEKK